MAVLDDLAVVGAPVTDPVAVARWLAALPLAGPQQARLLREYLAERDEPLTRAVLVAARDYSFELWRRGWVMARFRWVPFVGAARDAAASLAAAGESEADAVAALVDYTVTFGARYCPKALEQVFAQAPGDVAESLTDGITSLDAAIPLAVQAAWLEADAFARELFAAAPGDVVAFEDALSGWQAALEFAQAAFEAAGGLLPEEQDAAARASDGVDVYVAGFQPFRPAPGVSLADVLRSGPVEGFESDTPVEGFHCVEIAPGGFEVIEEEFFPPEFAPVAPPLGVLLAPAGPVVVPVGVVPPDAIWRLQAAGPTGLFIAADYPSRALALAAVSTVPVGWPWFVSWFVLVRDPVSLDLRASALTTTDSGVR